MKVLYYQRNAFNYQKSWTNKKKEFVVITLILDHEVFLVYVIGFNISFDIDNKVHLLKKAQIAH